MRRRSSMFGLLLLALPACKTLSEVSIGYADAVSIGELPAEGPWQQVRVAFPALTDVDPLASPSLARYAVTADEVEGVRLTGVELEGSTGACDLPFTQVTVQIETAELGPATIATATATGECLTWTLTPDLDLGPWFRQPKVSFVALVDGQPVADAGAGQVSSLRLSFLIDIADKRID